MKVELYEMLARKAISRRNLLKGAASASALAAVGPGLAGLATPAFAQENLRAEILKIPGVGAGSPTDADWQKVGEMCLGPTKEVVSEGELMFALIDR